MPVLVVSAAACTPSQWTVAMVVPQHEQIVDSTCTSIIKLAASSLILGHTVPLLFTLPLQSLQATGCEIVHLTDQGFGKASRFKDVLHGLWIGLWNAGGTGGELERI